MRTFLVVGLVTLLGACASSGANCTTPTACGTCVAQPGCGWCQAMRTCTAGTSAGPTTGTCGASWTITAASCPPVDAGPCAGSTDCASCTALAACGWCGATGTCMEGTGTAPAGCASGWAWISPDCPGAGTECPTLHDCATCTDDFNCGFCVSSGTCMASDGTMPTMGGSCPTSDFATGFDCPESPAVCAAHTDCAACAADDCGWCGATSTCLPANLDGTGPAMGSCAHAWAWIATDCPGSPDGGISDAGVLDGGASD